MKIINVGYEHYKNVYDFSDNVQTLTMHVHLNSNKSDCIKVSLYKIFIKLHA